MRTGQNTKREKAISAAILDALAAQISAEAEHEAVANGREADALETYARGIRNVAEALFIQSQPTRRGKP
jgi:hypothetical protein